MENSKSQKGQTLVETALVLLMLLVILIGIAEFARAWYTKNSYKNAARSGARLAVVTDSSGFPAGAIGNTTPVNCPNANTIINAVCTSPGVKNDSRTSVLVAVIDNDGSGSISAGDTVHVIASYTDANFFVVGGSPWPWSKTLSISPDASMRYE